MFEDKKILITGGTGSLGQALTKRLLDDDVKTIRILSRNEEKQVQMENSFNDNRLRFFLGDIVDYERLKRAFEDIDIVFHTAALKHVPKIEYNPFEAIKTNVIGSQNVINACLYTNVEKAIAIGTDKAVSPLNTYGATKLLMEKLFVTANNYINPEKHFTKFISVRYGNVFGSSGSVIPKFIEQIKKNQKITITDPKMTRFSITMNEALDFILNATISGEGSEIFVPKMKAYEIMDLVEVLQNLLGDTGQEIVGIRPGEKLHEILISEDEIRQTWEYNNMYLISNPLYSLFHGKSTDEIHKGITKLENLKNYSSDISDRISKSELQEMLTKSGLI
ncbi:UDP-N-acetylglucosamine 4,6-dehydratase [Nitrosopumilus zosterae]|uniref:UDP-N-acetylglucosamine 4,6-dehydratase n=1 Tax=Nitrosopumilus zosterae TaxID=718286 RepID=A0A2S2KUJ6_9ARCH|nr:SDR family NAD(P)-dependent oxidoreductase [Nitrosopumilus zosterae]BDQ31805.1 polysaccharide biosynthesis protein [Nitrosopumilus zosterae]GBH35155.1 UDP-N-acetylglucosamine 4,6-dehydratase [Nitrosopumilus zosterae]